VASHHYVFHFRLRRHHHAVSTLIRRQPRSAAGWAGLADSGSDHNRPDTTSEVGVDGGTGLILGVGPEVAGLRDGRAACRRGEVVALVAGA